MSLFLSCGELGRCAPVGVPRGHITRAFVGGKRQSLSIQYCSKTVPKRPQGITMFNSAYRFNMLEKSWRWAV